MRRIDFVTISTHLYPHDADLAVLRAQLEAEGIPYALGDIHSVSIAPLESLALGGVKIRIPAKYADRAAEIMAQIQIPVYVPPEEIDPEEVAWVAERLARQRQYNQQFLRWAPVIGGILFLLALLGVTLQKMMSQPASISPPHYSISPIR